MCVYIYIYICIYIYIYVCVYIYMYMYIYPPLLDETGTSQRFQVVFPEIQGQILVLAVLWCAKSLPEANGGWGSSETVERVGVTAVGGGPPVAGLSVAREAYLSRGGPICPEAGLCTSLMRKRPTPQDHRRSPGMGLVWCLWGRRFIEEGETKVEDISTLEERGERG